MIYTELYILKSKKEVVFKLAKHCSRTGAIFGFNLPSQFFLQLYKDDILAVFEHGDVIYANKAEAKFLYELIAGVKSEDILLICNELAQLPKINKQKRRIVVVTCGPEAAFIVEFDFNLNEATFIGSYAPEPIDPKSIVDTNGAGDAFAGGFLAKLVNGDPLDFCMRQVY